MYQYLTDDSSSELHTSEIDKCLELMLADPIMIVDKREMNPDWQSRCEVFWKQMLSKKSIGRLLMITDMDLMWLLEDYGKAVDDHRHGSDVAVRRLWEGC